MKLLNTAWNVITLNPTVRKAGVALYTTLATGLGTSLLDGALEGKEIAASVGAALIATAGVWTATNEKVPQDV